MFEPMPGRAIVRFVTTTDYQLIGKVYLVMPGSSPKIELASNTDAEPGGEGR